MKHLLLKMNTIMISINQSSRSLRKLCRFIYNHQRKRITGETVTDIREKVEMALQKMKKLAIVKNIYCQILQAIDPKQVMLQNEKESWHI
ncbi:hypothetical protein DEX24_14635 [Kurthia sibirica]|uniref:Uncharacterized protein n=1 Tax=Kurthia sibirica TaxID=202750 RepID=A0A2U3AI97_9BACL|nr:hypothetical protein DEX24_14635 [Kurthia sibirica]